MGTATLGLYSGSALALTGTLVPCSQVTWGLTCSRVAAVAGGVVGAISGGAIGATDRDLALARFRSAGIGAVAGGLTGFILRGLVRQYGWVDAGAGAALGGAVGASARGSAYGFAAGALVGTLLWRAVPSVELADAVGLSLAGLAVGGLGGWVQDALREGQVGEPSSQQPWLSMSVRLR